MRPACGAVAQLGLAPALGRFVVQLQAQFAINALCLVSGHGASLHGGARREHDDNRSDTNMAGLADLLFEGNLAGATGSVVVGRAVNSRASQVVRIEICQWLRTSSTRLHSFRRITSCIISFSSDRSATGLFNLPFSSSSCFSRRSVGSSPSYFLFQLK